MPKSRGYQGKNTKKVVKRSHAGGRKKAKRPKTALENARTRKVR